MATVQLESFSLIRSPTIVASSRRTSAAFPQYTGLKLRPVTATRLRSQSAGKVFPRGGTVVCEARDSTAVEG